MLKRMFFLATLPFFCCNLKTSADVNGSFFVRFFFLLRKMDLMHMQILHKFFLVSINFTSARITLKQETEYV